MESSKGSLRARQENENKLTARHTEVELQNNEKEKSWRFLKNKNELSEKEQKLISALELSSATPQGQCFYLKSQHS